MVTFNNFFVNPLEVRAHALASEYIDWKGYDGEVYKRIAITEVPGLTSNIEGIIGPVHMLGMGYRLNYEGELPNQLIHTDMGWGTHALVVYLNLPEDCQGGTAFWKHLPTDTLGVNGNDFQTLDKLKDHWNSLDKWAMRDMVSMEFNKGVIYPSHEYHSRYPLTAFGDSPENGRLVAVAFFTPKEDSQ